MSEGSTTRYSDPTECMLNQLLLLAHEQRNRIEVLEMAVTRLARELEAWRRMQESNKATKETLEG